MHNGSWKFLLRNVFLKSNTSLVWVDRKKKPKSKQKHEIGWVKTFINDMYWGKNVKIDKLKKKKILGKSPLGYEQNGLFVFIKLIKIPEDSGLY